MTDADKKKWADLTAAEKVGQGIGLALVGMGFLLITVVFVVGVATLVRPLL